LKRLPVASLFAIRRELDETAEFERFEDDTQTPTACIEGEFRLCLA